MRRRVRLVVALIAVALLAAAPGVLAQATTGRISGIVRDVSGGVLPGVSVTVTETRTGFTRTETSDAQGAYIFVSLPLGDYTVGAELQGFKKAAKSGFVLGTDGKLTADFHLEVGQFSETVQVTVGAETVNTVSGEVSRTVDRSQVEDLALNGRNYMQLATLVPGAPVTNFSALDIMTGLGINTVINGGRNNVNLLTVDGGFNMDSGSNNSQISNVGVDFIQEVSIKTANYSAEYRSSSGAAINVVTRSGSNQIKGSLFEYTRQDALDANDWYSILKGVKKAPLKYNNFGFSLGLPVMKDKLFFFGGMEWKIIRRFQTLPIRSLPTSAMRAGNFSALTGTLKDPVTGLAFPGNIIPANRITADGAAIAKVYELMAGKAVSYNDATNLNNALFQVSNPFDFRQEMTRLDYQPNGSHRLTGRVVFDHYSLYEIGTTFNTSQLPTYMANRKRPGRNVQLNHYWTLKGNMVNEFKFNYSMNGQKIPPSDDGWKRSVYGFQFAQIYPSGGTYEDSIPNVSISNYASFSGAARSLISPTWDLSVSDSLTWIKGAHTVKGGALFIRNGKDQNGRSDYAGVVSFSTSGNPSTTSNAFADALLGNFRTYTEAQLDPMGYFRFSQTEAFIQDSWRLTPRLSVDIGVRYVHQVPTSTLGNNTASFDPAMYNPAQAVTLVASSTTSIVPNSGNRYNGLTRPGDVPAGQLANVPNANSPDVKAVPFAANSGYYKAFDLWSPRMSFAWTPFADSKTVVRGGAGLFYDRLEGNFYFELANNPPFNLSSTFQNGNLANIQAGSVPPIAVWGSIGSISPDLQIPRTWSYSVGVQRELPWGLFAEVSYVGATAQHLARQPDINQASLADLAANQAGPKYDTNYLRPYKGFSNIRMRMSDSKSQYDSLQAAFSKRRGDLNFSLNYTYSKAYDNASGSTADLEDFMNPSYNWGPSDNNRPHIFVGTWTYRLPFFRNQNTLMGNALGGWEVSGIFRYQSGAPFSVSGNTTIGGRRADYLGGNPYLPNGPVVDAATGTVTYLDITQFTAAPEGRRGTSGRNQFHGPAVSSWDLSIRKNFRIATKYRVQIIADLFNAFNQVNYNTPSVTNVSTTGFGGITTLVVPSRNVQLGCKITF